uniref:hypothetical protein n=1 Tax=Halostella sp. PRR32 TaxID=3098147 RepID=UPI002B1DE240
LGITNSLGLTNIPTNIIATSTAVGSAACGSNALVSASLVGTMETHNELAKAKMNTLGQMPSSGSSASVAKAGIGRVTVRNFVQSQSMASDQKN